MSEINEYYQLVNSIGWFIVAVVVYSGFYVPSTEDVILGSLVLGVISLVNHFVPDSM